MKPRFEAEVALKYNPYPDSKYKIIFDDEFWLQNRETMEQTFFRLLTRQQFFGLRDFLRSLFETIAEAICCVNNCDTVDALLKDSGATILGQKPSAESRLVCMSARNVDCGRKQMKFTAFEGRKVWISSENKKVLEELYFQFRGVLLEARRRQREDKFQEAYRWRWRSW
jgi:hypothetical protein